MKPYFSHDEGARNDPKLVRVLMRLGQAGKGVYWDLVEMLHEQGGYLPLGDLESMAFGLRTDLPTLTSLLNDFGLFNQDAERFWSETALTRLQLRNAKAEARAAAGAKGGKAKAEKLAMLQQNHSIASEEPSNAMVLPAETLASKEKESKEKESKPLPTVEDAASAAEPASDLVEASHQEIAQPTQSPTPGLRTPGGRADVGTSVGDGQKGQKGQKPEQKDKPIRFTPPAYEDILGYMVSQRPHNPPAEVERVAAKCFGYYSGNGWRVGKNPMKDWKGGCQTFLADLPKRELGSTHQPPLTGYNGAIGQRPSQITTRAAAIAGADAMFDALAAGQDPYALTRP